VILVTVGSMLPFDRLIEAMDKWAADHPGHSLFAQIGKGASSADPPEVWRERLATVEGEG